jgi:hypothetical protein
VAWNAVQKWYKHAGDRPPRPTRLDLQIVTDYYKELYRTTPLTNEPLNVQLPPYTVNDDIPNHHEVATAVRGLRNGKTPGTSGLRAEHLKELLRQAERDDATPAETQGWEQVCNIIQQIFETGEIPEEMTWSILVLIRKTSGGTRGIGVLETMWKVVSSIINNRLQTSILFHEALHGFRRRRGTGMASLNAKLQMQLAHIQGVPLYQLFLDLSKAYDTLDRTRTLQLLNRYCVGGKIL